MKDGMYGKKRLCLMGLVFFVASMAMAGRVYYVHLPGGGVDAYPEGVVTAAPVPGSDGALSVTLTDGQTIRYAQGAYVSCDEECPDLPRLVSFKFNNKFNANLPGDVEVADEVLDTLSTPATLTLTLNAIGKRLTPSFRTDGEALVSVDGKPVYSKLSRLRFDHDITFTVGQENYYTWKADAQGNLVRVPFGNEYTIHPVWLTDNAKNVPRIDINIDGGQTVTSKSTYLHAQFKLTGNGVYEDMADEVYIKGRGNTSWGWPKKPYRLKFNDKVKPFGLTAGKSWVLLSNYNTGSMLTNPLAMKMSQLIDAPAANHMIPVELYINGSYAGSYDFTEKIGFGNNSIDADETLGYLLTLDVMYDEPYKFKSSPIVLPANFKEPDLTTWDPATRQERFDEVQADFNRSMAAIYNKTDDVGDLIDLESIAQFLFVQDFTNNCEVNWPKSVYCYKEDLSNPDAKLVFGPEWDFDWAFGYNYTSTYCDDGQYGVNIQNNTLEGSTFLRYLTALGIVNKYYYKEWSDFLAGDALTELQEYVEDFYNFASVSFANDSKRWGKNYDYGKDINKTKTWLKQRANYVYTHLKAYDISDLESDTEGDVNLDGQVSVTDALLTFQYVMGQHPEVFYKDRADLNFDGTIDMSDVICVVRRILAASRQDMAPIRSRVPSAYACLTAETFDIGLGERADVPVTLFCDSDCTDGYQALQVDIVAPEGITLESVTAEDGLAGMNVSSTLLDDGSLRLVAIPNATDGQLDKDATLFTLHLRADGVSTARKRYVTFSGGHLTDQEGDERRMRSSSVAFAQATAIDDVTCDEMRVTGGHELTVTALAEQDIEVTGIDGRAVRTLHVEAGDNRFELPAGVYVVAGVKVAIY